jgi:cytochrome subunit of sulfide dehydrogenase
MEETMNVRYALATMAGFACLTGPALAADAAKIPGEPVCLIAGWENPPSVCAAHTKTIAATCYICHGPNGKSSGAIPGLAGQDKAYLATAMKEFRDGKREATVMKKYALGYTDSEYEALGEFFAAIK